jgi:hypothetical protein
MFLTFTPSSPDRGESEEYHFDPSHFRNLDAEAIERELGQTWPEFVVNVQKGQTAALRMLLWAFRRRTHGMLKPADVRFDRGEVDLKYDRDEIELMIKEAEQRDPVREEDRTMRDRGIELLRAQLETAPAAPGKANAPLDDGSTS